MPTKTKNNLHKLFPKWRKRVDSAKKNGKFSPISVSESGPWKTCAVGERREILQKLGIKFYPLFFNPLIDGEQSDSVVKCTSRISQLGGQFPMRVVSHDAVGAEKILDELDSIVCELEKEQKKNGTKREVSQVVEDSR